MNSSWPTRNDDGGQPYGWKIAAHGSCPWCSEPRFEQKAKKDTKSSRSANAKRTCAVLGRSSPMFTVGRNGIPSPNKIPLAVGVGSSQEHANPSSFVPSHQHLGRPSNATNAPSSSGLPFVTFVPFCSNLCLHQARHTPSSLLSPLLLSWPSIATLHFR